MGPLVPEIISEEFNFIIALMLGFGFGFALEQAGFSSTRKLVGLFYGYDFTVLRVFFTAGVTAMIGVLVLNHLGLLDLKLIYVNPTFLSSALIGGGIMGAGFIIGGFCPGTSVCAAAIGKIDGLVFIAGSLLGILMFTEGYPLLENMYLAQNWGAVRINDFFGISKGLFGLILSAVAVGAFIFTSRVQDKVNKVAPGSRKLPGMNIRILAALPFIVLAGLAVMPDHHEIIKGKIEEERRQHRCKFREIDMDKLAYDMVNHNYEINIIDVRPAEAFKASHIPLAINIPLDSMFNREWEQIFSQKIKRNVFYADVDTTAKMACLTAKYLGGSENSVLNVSSAKFIHEIMNPENPPADATKKVLETHRFRVGAARDIRKLEESLKNINAPVKKSFKKAKGGCA